jgi:hypothetical protein
LGTPKHPTAGNWNIIHLFDVVKLVSDVEKYVQHSAKKKN